MLRNYSYYPFKTTDILCSVVAGFVIFVFIVDFITIGLFSQDINNKLMLFILPKGST